MNLSATEEQDELRASLRRFLTDKSPSAALRRAMDSDEGHDPALWEQMAGQLGMQGVAVPEEFGGAGYGPVELGIVCEELGRAVTPTRFFATVALAAQALVHSGDRDAQARWLPGIADGTLTATVALAEERGGAVLDAIGTVAVREGDVWRLSGTKMFVVDGDSADLVLVVARTDEGLGLFACEGSASGMVRTRLDALDPTRRLGRIELAGTPARRVGPGGDATRFVQRVLDLAVVALAHEQVGCAAACLDAAVEYARIRVQFERPIGSFQAVKHTCADLLLEVEGARSAAYSAAWTAAEDIDDLPVAAAVAGSWCSETATHAAKANLQIHGGVGYTWEHDAHLFLKRAKSSELLFGTPVRHRARIADLVGLEEPPVQTLSEATPIAAETDDEFRARVRGFLTDHHPGRPPKDPGEKLAWQRAWLATLFDHGFAGPSWPREYGGMELDFAQQVIYQEEYARARVPGPLGTGVGIAAPTIIRYGTPEQKQRHLRPLLRGDSVWAQGYSEPEAGSDLPALRTTARRDGDTYVVNGQKVWNTSAEIADVIFTLVRTGAPGSRQHGISYLLVDAHAPGVIVRPLRDITGGATFAEIFFSDVRVPVSDRIGEENEGWKLARTSLGHERAAGSMNQAARYRRVLDELEELARERGVAGEPLVRDRLADFEIRVRLMRWSGMRTISDIAAKGEPGPGSSTTRLFSVLFEQDLHEFAVEMLGEYGVLGRRDPHAVQRGRWVMGFLSTRASTIGAGTAEIQRNTIAEQVLGLPRDPAMPSRD